MQKHFYLPKLHMPSVWNMVKIIVDRDKCIGCGNCVDVCPVGVYELDEEQKSVPVNADECIACLACETECPSEAIQVIEEEEG